MAADAHGRKAVQGHAAQFSLVRRRGRFSAFLSRPCPTEAELGKQFTTTVYLREKALSAEAK